jgi:sugar lactone lactonase YvrE
MQGALRHSVVRPVPSSAANGLYQPEGVTLQSGEMWVADTYNNRILRFTVTRK